MSLTPLYKPLKKNGTTLYVFPSVEEDKNYESQNENYRMFLSHYVLVNFPKQTVSTIFGQTQGTSFDIEDTFYQNSTSIPPASFKDALVESLRNYVANEESTIRNSLINSNTFYYDTSQPYTTTEKIFWKWCKNLNLIGFEPANATQQYFGADPKYNNNGPSGNTTYYREYLWRERSTTIYDVLGVQVATVPSGTTPAGPLPTAPTGTQYATITLTSTTTLKPGDNILLNQPGIDNVTPGHGYSLTQSLLPIIAIATTTTLNDTIIVEIDSAATLASFGTIPNLELYNAYNRFLQFICEIGGLNNVKLPDKSYTEAYAYISHQHGQIPYALWNLLEDNNYKPNSQFPILPTQIQAEIQGGENANNPILTNPTAYPGDIWGQFDNASFLYTTQTGDINRQWGNYYGNTISTANTDPTIYPYYDGSTIDGLTLNLNINDYAEAVSYVYPIASFNEFCATSFNNIPPNDFQFNAILWYYTIEDVSGNTLQSATNLYGVEFLDTPDNDLLFAKSKIPVVQKLVSNGAQDGNAYTFSLDTNIAIDSDTQPPSFDPDKVYSLFGMELFYEALTRITYFNDQLTNFVNSNLSLNQRMDDLTGLVYNQQSLETIRNRQDNIENLLNVYSTLQIGVSDTIEPFLDTSVTPPLLRLNSVDKQYGYIYQFDTKSMFSEFTDVNSLTDISIIEQTAQVVNGKDFLIIVNNNDNRVPTIPYDTTKTLDSLSLVINQDLNYKQKIDIILIPKTNTDIISTLINPVNEPINDKALNLFINYNDGTNIIKQQLGTFNLPVLKYYNGSAAIDEPVVGLQTIPSYKIRDVFYSKANANDRVFSFVIDSDLVSTLPALSRIFIDNFQLQSNPAIIGNTYTDFSGQYAVYNTTGNPTYVRSNVIDVQLVSPGSVYSNGPASALIHTPSMIYTADINLTVNGSGNITGVELLNSNGLTLSSLVGTSVTVPPNGTGPAGTGGTVKFIVKSVTKISISMNINANPVINTFLTAYDSALSIGALPNNTFINIDKYLNFYPSLSLFRGYKISIVRISDIDLPVTLLNQRYNIKIDRI